jgi:mono/diheme cytochrome c family protein
MWTMPSRPLDLLKPRSLALLAIGLSLERLVLGRPRRRPVPTFPSALPPAKLYPVGPLIALACVVAAGATVGCAAWRDAVQTRAVAIALTRGDPQRAPAHITRYGCGGCHAIPGIQGADGRVAGPLGGLRERVYVGGVLRNTGENLTRWILDPPAFSPGTAMPVTGISEQEARDVAAYLYTR